MLAIHHEDVRLCDGWSRRDLLRVGGLGWLGLSLPGLIAARRHGSPSGPGSFGRARSCLLLFLSGGPSHFETFDPKPDAPVEVRGVFRPIPTAVPGVRISELLPSLARLAGRYCLLRAVSTGINAHAASGYWMFTGRPHPRGSMEVAASSDDWPSITAMVGRLRPGTAGMPSAVVLPERLINNPNVPWPGQTGGFMGPAWDPLLFTCDPAAADFSIPALAWPPGLTAGEVRGRQRLLDRVNHRLDHLVRSEPLVEYDAAYRQALDLLSSAAARRAFDLRREDPRLRDRYGRTKWGQSVLLARRLVEAGAGLVQVNWPREPGDTTSNSPLWDSHANNNQRYKTVLCPQLDQTVSALLEDLDVRGLLDETLVVCMGEFGRTPRFNAAAGRDHWGHVYSVLIGGGGIQGGVVHGSSDRQGAYPAEGRVQPEDLLATIYHCLGIRPDTEFHDRLGRPLAVCNGTAIRPILPG